MSKSKNKISVGYLMITLFLYLIEANTVFAQYPNGRALLIGISNYQNKEWRYTSDHKERILSSDSDVAQMKKLLLEKGFKAENITTLLDDNATKKGIEEAIDNLIISAQKNSFVVLHFSGHGQQIYDKEPEKDEVDGFDEAIVPTDAPMHFDETITDHEKHIRDDYLNAKLNELRKKTGPGGAVLVLLDACHSGSATRGNEELKDIARGTAGAYMPKDYKPDFDGDQNREAFEKIKNDAALAPMTCFFACGPGELNYEAAGKHMGSLTFSFISALNECDSACSYNVLFEKIKTVMASIAPNQRPQYDGDLSLNIFNDSKYKKTRFFFPGNFMRPNKCEIKAGALQGIGKGTRVGFYKAGTDTSTTKPFALGRIERSDLNGSIVSFDSGTALKPENIEKAWVYPLFTVLPFNIKINIKRTDVFSLREAVSACHFAEISESESQLKTYYNKKKDSVVFENKYGYITGKASLKNSDSLKIQTRKILLKASKAEYFRNMISSNNARLNASLEIFPFGYKLEERLRNGKVSLVPVIADSIPKKNIIDYSGNIRIKDSTFLKIKVNSKYRLKNFDLYYAVLDIQPDDVVNVITDPKKLNLQPDEFVVEKYEVSAELPRAVRISPPYGKENFVLITSSEPVDFSGILGARGGIQNMSELINVLRDDDDTILSRGRQFGANDIDVNVFGFEIIR